MYELLTVALSIYALSTLLTAYDGLGGVFTYLRTLKPLESLLACPVLLSITKLCYNRTHEYMYYKTL